MAVRIGRSFPEIAVRSLRMGARTLATYKPLPPFLRLRPPFSAIPHIPHNMNRFPDPFQSKMQLVKIYDPSDLHPEFDQELMQRCESASFDSPEYYHCDEMHPKKHANEDNIYIGNKKNRYFLKFTKMANVEVLAAYVATSMGLGSFFLPTQLFMPKSAPSLSPLCVRRYVKALSFDDANNSDFHNATRSVSEQDVTDLAAFMMVFGFADPNMGNMLMVHPDSQFYDRRRNVAGVLAIDNELAFPFGDRHKDWCPVAHIVAKRLGKPIPDLNVPYSPSWINQFSNGELVEMLCSHHATFKLLSFYPRLNSDPLKSTVSSAFLKIVCNNDWLQQTLDPLLFTFFPPSHFPEAHQAIKERSLPLFSIIQNIRSKIASGSDDSKIILWDVIQAVREAED